MILMTFCVLPSHHYIMLLSFYIELQYCWMPDFFSNPVYKLFNYVKFPSCGICHKPAYGLKNMVRRDWLLGKLISSTHYHLGGHFSNLGWLSSSTRECSAIGLLNLSFKPLWQLPDLAKQNLRYAVDVWWWI